MGHFHEADGLSLQSCLHYVRAAKQLSKWLWREGRTRVDTLAPVHGYNGEQDRRRVRRELSDGELTALIRAADAGPDILGVPGRDRAVLYIVAVTSGLRAAELRSLTPESCVRDAAPPRGGVVCARPPRRPAPPRPGVATVLTGHRQLAIVDQAQRDLSTGEYP